MYNIPARVPSLTQSERWLKWFWPWVWCHARHYHSHPFSSFLPKNVCRKAEAFFFAFLRFPSSSFCRFFIRIEGFSISGASISSVCSVHHAHIVVTNVNWQYWLRVYALPWPWLEHINFSSLMKTVKQRASYTSTPPAPVAFWPGLGGWLYRPTPDMDRWSD